MTPSLIRTSVAAATLGLMALGAQAQSSVTAYGLMDMSAGQFQAAGSAKTWRAESGNMTTSFLGFKGTEDLGGGLKANFTIEHFLRLDNGEAGRFNTDAFWARSAYVGLQGSFGQTRLGRNTTPLFVSTLIFNPFGDSFGFAPSIRHYFLGAISGDTGWRNSLAYSSPNLGGATVNLLGNLGEGTGTGRNMGGNVLYFAGPLAATFAVQQVKNGVFPVPAGFDKQDAWQLGASYDLGAAKLFGQIGQVKTDATTDVKVKLYQLGVSAPVGGGKILASYGNAKTTTPTTSTRKTFSAGYDYNLSKSTDVYAVLMNDKATGLASGNTVAAGVRLRF
jgi:predicted porin